MQFITASRLRDTEHWPFLVRKIQVSAYHLGLLAAVYGAVYGTDVPHLLDDADRRHQRSADRFLIGLIGLIGDARTPSVGGARPAWAPAQLSHDHERTAMRGHGGAESANDDTDHTSGPTAHGDDPVTEPSDGERVCPDWCTLAPGHVTSAADDPHYAVVDRLELPALRDAAGACVQVEVLQYPGHSPVICLVDADGGDDLLPAMRPADALTVLLTVAGAAATALTNAAPARLGLGNAVAVAGLAALASGDADQPVHDRPPTSDTATARGARRVPRAGRTRPELRGRTATTRLGRERRGRDGRV